MKRTRSLPSTHDGPRRVSLPKLPDRPSVKDGPQTPESRSGGSKTLAEALASKRGQILEGAEAVFMEQGYEGASMSQIARRSGVSKGTLYNHFENKASLFGAVIDDLSRSKLAPIPQKHDASVPFSEAVRALAENFIRFLISPGPLRLYSVIVSEAPRFPDIVHVFYRYGFGFLLDHFVEQFDDWCRRGDLRIDDTLFAAEQFMALCHTRIAQRKRFNLEVNASDEHIREVAQRTATAFIRIYAVD